MSITKPSIPKGTRDFGTNVMFKRNYIFDTIRSVFQKFGYMQIETPAMENLKVLTGKYGDEGDQLLFKLLKSGNYLNKTEAISGDSALYANDLSKLDLETKKELSKHTFCIAEKGLRYDLTVPFARFVVMHQSEIAFPFKRYQIQPVWRADRPQKGRYQEFYQCDADVVGTKSLLCEAEIILMINEVLQKLGISDYDIKINNRKILSGIAHHLGLHEQETDLFVAIDKLDKIGLEGVNKELLSKGISEETVEKLNEIMNIGGNNDSKVAQLKASLQNETGQAGIKEIEEVLSLVHSFGESDKHLAFDITLARGLSYYTGAIFEVKVNNVKIGSISGGGRYDNLTGTFGLKDISGVGFSFGVDRIYDVMEELDLFGELDTSTTKVILCSFDNEAFVHSLKLLKSLRQNGISAELYPEAVKMRKQLNYADKKGIPYVIVVGSDEITSQKYPLKDMKTGNQTVLNIEELLNQLK